MCKEKNSTSSLTHIRTYICVPQWRALCVGYGIEICDVVKFMYDENHHVFVARLVEAVSLSVLEPAVAEAVGHRVIVGELLGHALGARGGESALVVTSSWQRR